MAETASISVFAVVFSPTYSKAKFRKKKLFKQILSQFSLVRIQFYLSRASGKSVG